MTHTSTLSSARPGSDRFRCGGRESNFLAAKPSKGFRMNFVQKLTLEVMAFLSLLCGVVLGADTSLEQSLLA